MCICETSIVIRTSDNFAAILDLEHTSTSHETGSTIIRKFDPENIDVRVAVGILSLCALELQICLGPFHPSPVAGKRRKNSCREKGYNSKPGQTSGLTH